MRNIHVLVILVSLLLCSVAYASDWTRDGEFLIDTNVVYGPGANSQNFPAVAFDGTNYLVVWEDDRNGDWDIYGARVDQNGNVIDPLAIPISVSVADQGEPAVCFSGSDYLVVWNDGRNAPYSASDIYGARVNQAGVVLDPMGIAISTAAGPQLNPSIAFDGINYLVVWQDARNDTLGFSAYDIYGARLNQNGVVLDSDGIGVKVDSGNPYWSERDYRPVITFDGTHYFVVWLVSPGPMPDFSLLYGIHVDPMGAVLDILDITGPTLVEYPDVDFDGTNYFVVRCQQPFNFRSGIYSSRVDQSGCIIDTIGFFISSFYDNPHPSVVFDGINYIVAWNDMVPGYSEDIYGAKLNTSGVVVASFSITLQEGEQDWPAMAGGTNAQVLITYVGWTGTPVNTMRIWGKFYPFVGVEEGETSIAEQRNLTATIFRGPLQLPEGKKCRVFDIAGRLVEPYRIQPGVYFIEIEGVVTQKVVKIR